MKLFSYDTEKLPRVRMIGHVKYQNPWRHFARRLDEYVLYVIKEGDMYLREAGVNYHLKEGDFFLLEPGLLHEGYQAAACDYYYMHFKHPNLFPFAGEEREGIEEMKEKRRKSLMSYNLDEEEVIDPYTCLPKKFHLAERDFRQKMKHAIEIYNQREEHYRRRTASEMHSFLLEVAHNYLIYCMGHSGARKKRADLAAEQLLQYLNNNYSEKIRSSDIEENFEMNFDYLNRVFSKMTGNTIFSYLNIVRINSAKQMIMTTNLSFGEIAYLVGIEDRYYFSKLFKKYVGVTPTEYLKCSHITEQKQEERKD